ncbi:histone-arginine methyltransferase METTL23 isoform X2 [Aquarana catesbeiana]|uniref:histone-arginine methyltransferase METTL23 isoform X2 n=1 Tax=Aquarana catesbeiana TaxID=8400 RepID=UPI003CCA4010
MGEEGELRVVLREYVYVQEEGEEDGELRLIIPEVLDSEYGMYVWPCALVLAQYIWFHRSVITGKRVLEVGSGVSLPGVLAAKCAANVILSDSAAMPQCLQNCSRSCRQNNLSGIPVIGLTWDFEDILVTVQFIMERNPKAEFWTTYQVRSEDWSIEALLHKWNFKCTNVPLKIFDADKECLAGSNLPGRHSIQMMIITLNLDNLD